MFTHSPRASHPVFTTEQPPKLPPTSSCVSAPVIVQQISSNIPLSSSIIQPSLPLVLQESDQHHATETTVQHHWIPTAAEKPRQFPLSVLSGCPTKRGSQHYPSNTPAFCSTKLTGSQGSKFALEGQKRQRIDCPSLDLPTFDYPSLPDDLSVSHTIP